MDKNVCIRRYLLRKRARVRATSDSGETPLHAAARQGHLEVVKALLYYGSKWNQPDEEGATPLHAAARAGQDEVWCSGQDKNWLFHRYF